ncbi:TetR/AcrR family transcriptional regulator [Clostridium neuense]|uniref:TetR/AcrR family transcriptional regulator n=1 Tax=Clostridium neuense TaxID=1728934 RepID=A0ABW8TFN9_9CLOT
MNKTKRSIFESALKIFSNSGYSEATMDDIAINAGVAKGTLYYHFKSKEEIFKYVISEGMNVITEEMEEATKHITDPIQKIIAVCKVQFGLVYRNKDFFKVVMSQLWGQESRQFELREVVRVYIGEIERFLKEAMDAGALKKGETEFMAYTLFGTICSGAVYELINDNQKKIDDLVESITSYILKGIETDK